MLGQTQEEESRFDRIFTAVIKAAQELFPEESKRAEEWAIEELERRGIIKAREFVHAKALEAQANPFFWIVAAGMGLAAVMALRKAK